MAGARIILASEQVEWAEALQRCGIFDTYHRVEYHLLAQQAGEGEPFLFFYTDGKDAAAMPLLLRRVAEVGGLEDEDGLDVTSVYGYPGPIFSTGSDSFPSQEFRQQFQRELKSALDAKNCITAFSRLNPSLHGWWLLEGFGELIGLGQTVAIDLSHPEDKQLKGMSKGHRYDIRKYRRLGVTVWEDERFEHLDTFIEIYNETMKRRGASDYYFFPRDYYLNLRLRLGDSLRLFFASYDGQVVSGSMFLFGPRIVQYHLSGTRTEYANLSGAKLILDHVRQEATRLGKQELHLGGGVGSREDALFRFKAGFSKLRRPFRVFRATLNPSAEARLVEKRKSWLKKQGKEFHPNGFFPAYRAG